MRGRLNSAATRKKKSSTRSTSKKNSLEKQNHSIKNWNSILDQINIVTEKVKILYSNEKSQKRLDRSKWVTPFDFYEQNTTPIKEFLDKQQSQDLHRQTPTSYNHCNSKCHELMDECKQLNQRNECLQKQKEGLEKRLFFESKEKRQLRWKLEKEMSRKNRQIYKYNCTLPEMDKIDLFEKKDQCNFSEISCATAKKSSPLKEKCFNFFQLDRFSFKNNKMSKEEGRSDSLLIDMDSNEENYVEIDRFNHKMAKEIELQKQFHDLLQRSRLERDTTQKKVIRNQMKVIAQEIKSLKL